MKYKNSKDFIMPKIPIGIEGFDKFCKKGIPEKKLTVVMGPPRSGKTIFGMQFLIRGILISKEPGVFITLDENQETVISKTKELGWDISEYVNQGLWEFIDVSSHFKDDYEISGDFDLGGLLLQIQMAVRKIKAKRIVMDSLSVLFSKYPDIETIKKGILQLKSWLNTYSVTSLIIDEIDGEILKKIYSEIINKTCDSIIKLQNPLKGGYRTIEIIKYQGNNYLKGKLNFTIEKNQGIVIVPID